MLHIAADLSLLSFRLRNRVIMSTQPKLWPEVPAQTALVARKAIRQEALPVRVRDELGAWCRDEGFPEVYVVRSRSALSPAQLAVVTALQFAENMTDRQAADAVRGRLDWKYCLGLELDDPGFDDDVLSDFRSRLEAGGRARVLLESLLTRLTRLGLVGAPIGHQPDPAQVLAGIRDLNRLALIAETAQAAVSPRTSPPGREARYTPPGRPGTGTAMIPVSHDSLNDGETGAADQAVRTWYAGLEQLIDARARGIDLMTQNLVQPHEGVGPLPRASRTPPGAPAGTAPDSTPTWPLRPRIVSLRTAAEDEDGVLDEPDS